MSLERPTQKELAEEERARNIFYARYHNYQGPDNLILSSVNLKSQIEQHYQLLQCINPSSKLLQLFDITTGGTPSQKARDEMRARNRYIFTCWCLEFNEFTGPLMTYDEDLTGAIWNEGNLREAYVSSCISNNWPIEGNEPRQFFPEAESGLPNWVLLTAVQDHESHKRSK